MNECKSFIFFASDDKNTKRIFNDGIKMLNLQSKNRVKKKYTEKKTQPTFV